MAKTQSLTTIYNLYKRYRSGRIAIKLPKSKFKMPKISGIKVKKAFS